MVATTPGAVEQVVAAAQYLCEKRGGRLTQKRQRVLELLLQAERPMSAYDIMDAYNRYADTTIMAMSVYRILGFLESTHLVHRLHSANKYIACNYIICSCEHHTALLLICRSCQHVREIMLPTPVVNAISHQAEVTGFEPLGSQLEMSCLCENCKKSTKNLY
ncbi:transcriptional repressor [Alteromonas pelagimontana]|uniref:Transcriptional repressor n=1 Tax=Alteromonas pelagimontana TaxID=1858656 RepID=A0A6M4MFW5_9ALTE|nr:transcriptional repressor [Alteromonas pelagimontana]QJR81086.1 transcriptional repressor [Alteromonas pelagimontana]